MTYPEIKQQLLANPAAVASRPHWDICRTIRSFNDGDYDFFQNCDLAGVIMEDCPKACDCHTAIFQPAPDDLSAADYRILN